jgi:cytochrome c oxidase assembly protein subunit 15
LPAAGPASRGPYAGRVAWVSRRLRPASAALVRTVALATVVANAAIVVTGGAVRLTDSGLGCPTVPRCTDSSYVPTAATAGHGLIEFTNRMLTFVLTAVVLAMLVTALRSRPRRAAITRLSVAVLAGIPAQAVLGAVTVRTGLNPWTVMAHFLLSMVILAAAVTLWWRAVERADGPPAPVVRPELLALGRILAGVTGAVLVLGTVVTGSGPHAGDPKAGRTGFDLETVSQLHADAVMLLVGLTAATVLALRATRAPAAVRRAAGILLGIELAQGVLGFVQYFTGLPAVLVGLHLLGASLVWIAAVRTVLSMRARTAVPTAEPAEPVPPVRDSAGEFPGPGGELGGDRGREPVRGAVGQP